MANSIIIIRKHFLFVVFIALPNLIDEICGQSACSTFSDSSSCNRDNGTYCKWDSSNSVCACNNTMSQDIIFLIDSSDYLSDDDFEYVKTFITNILYHGSPPSTRVGLATYTLSTTEILSLNDSTDVISAIDLVISTNRTGFSGTPNVQSAAAWAIDEFNLYSTTERRTLVTIMSGLSSNSPCANSINVKKENIDSYVVAIGTGWEKRAYRCYGVSDNDYEGLIAIDTISDLPNSSQQLALELLTCPHNILLKITEVRPTGNEPSDRFFEFYNKGEDFEATDISFDGLFIGSLTGISQTITQGSITVVYSSQSAANRLPNCTYCSCTLQTTYENITQCEDANYFACGTSTPAGPYEVQSSGCVRVTMDVTDWNVTILDSATDEVLDEVIYNSDTTWVRAVNGYAYELKYYGYNNNFGSSWGPTCDKHGTPGDVSQNCMPMVNGCDGSNDLCRAGGGGDNSAICTGSNECSCSDFWYNYNNITCHPYPTPENCTGVHDTSLTNYVSDQPYWDGLFRYEIEWCEVNGIAASVDNCSFGNPARGFGYPVVVTVSGMTTEGWSVYESRLRLIDRNGNTYSEYTNCTTITNSPTMSPTDAPTYASGNVPWCEYELSQDLDEITIRWSPVNDSLNSPPDIYLDGYQWIQTGDTAALNIGRCCNYSQQIVSFDVDTDTVKVAPDYTIDSGLDFNDELSGAKLCDQITQVPTAAPTGFPSVTPSTPSTQPTYNPSLMPTFAPTYSYLSISSCDVVFQAGSLNNITIAWVEPTFDYPNTVDESDITYDLYVEGESSPRAEIEYSKSSPQYYLFETVPDWNEEISMKIQVNTTIDPNGDNYPSTNCSKTTFVPSASPSFTPSAPSVTPTAGPSDFPTINPTLSPSMSPSTSPSVNPTTAPSVTTTASPSGNGVNKNQFDMAVYMRVLVAAAIILVIVCIFSIVLVRKKIKRNRDLNPEVDNVLEIIRKRKREKNNNNTSIHSTDFIFDVDLRSQSSIGSKSTNADETLGEKNDNDTNDHDKNIQLEMYDDIDQKPRLVEQKGTVQTKNVGEQGNKYNGTNQQVDDNRDHDHGDANRQLSLGIEADDSGSDSKIRYVQHTNNVNDNNDEKKFEQNDEHDDSQYQIEGLQAGKLDDQPGYGA